VQRLFANSDDELDAVLAVNGPPDATFFWATGLHEGGTFEGSACVMRPDEPVTVVTSPLEETTARKSDNRVEIYEDREAFWDTLDAVFDENEAVGYDPTALSVSRFDEIEDSLDVDLVQADDAIEAARLIKDPDEVDRIENACRITDEIAETMEAKARDADTEADLAARIVHAILAEGAKLSFDPIVAWGPGSAEPHYAPGDVRLDDGALLVDMGAKLAGYCSDITRTYAIGEPSERLERMHEVTVRAQQAALDAIEPGKEASNIHETAREVIDDTEFEGRFIHSLGHSLGVEVHDGPGLSPHSEVTLEEGMVFTVEPGIYVPDEAGVRVEEDVVVTSDGCRRLTDADRELRVLDL